ncbi:MAG: hypothetical protein QXX08_05785, partial [Candidatus Bathyarchaeia archaeon]
YTKREKLCYTNQQRKRTLSVYVARPQPKLNYSSGSRIIFKPSLSISICIYVKVDKGRKLKN